jgi:PleD family two-component response regulator
MKREREFFSVILCMVDNFLIKKDKLSETQIKKLLKIVAQGIGKSINRPTDAFTDYQPGQFLVLLSNTSPEGVKKIAKTIETNINDCQETWIQSITVSVRILSLIPSPQDTLKKIMASLTSSITPGSSPEEN